MWERKDGVSESSHGNARMVYQNLLMGTPVSMIPPAGIENASSAGLLYAR